MLLSSIVIMPLKPPTSTSSASIFCPDARNNGPFDVGQADGTYVGKVDGAADGNVDEDIDGDWDGAIVGTAEGNRVGTTVGMADSSLTSAVYLPRGISGRIEIEIATSFPAPLVKVPLTLIGPTVPSTFLFEEENIAIPSPLTALNDVIAEAPGVFRAILFSGSSNAKENMPRPSSSDNTAGAREPPPISGIVSIPSAATSTIGADASAPRSASIVANILFP